MGIVRTKYGGMSPAERKAFALKLASSARGQYIIGQALYYGIAALEAVPMPHREISNIADMNLLMNELFPVFAAVTMAEAEFDKERH